MQTDFVSDKGPLTVLSFFVILEALRFFSNHVSDENAGFDATDPFSFSRGERIREKENINNQSE
jgi:hypothetical protein